MAASDMTGELADVRPRTGLRLLAFAYFLLFAILVLGGIAVVLFGDPRAAEPVVRFTLNESPVSVAATHPASAAPPAAPVAPPANASEPVPPPAIVP